MGVAKGALGPWSPFFIFILCRVVRFANYAKSHTTVDWTRWRHHRNVKSQTSMFG